MTKIYLSRCSIINHPNRCMSGNCKQPDVLISHIHSWKLWIILSSKCKETEMIVNYLNH